MLCCRNAKIAFWQIRYSVVSKFAFISPSQTVCDLDNIRIEFLRFHGAVCFKIKETKLYSFK